MIELRFNIIIGKKPTGTLVKIMAQQFNKICSVLLLCNML
jgi:hypothetical protein